MAEAETTVGRRARLAELLRQETTGGMLVIAAAIGAVAAANTPLAAAYGALRDLRLGPADLHLDLTLTTWASDGLLALFFFLVGLELKTELRTGSLRHPARAIVPVAAALGGVLVPAAIYVASNLGDPAGLRGWPIPTATDIAFALAVLAVVGRGLPAAARLFLLTLAIVDDLVAIVLIAALYAQAIDITALALAAAPIAGFGWLVRRRGAALSPSTGLLLGVLAIATWLLVHASGVHATIAGVLLAATVPIEPAERSIAGDVEHRLRPLSAGVAVPIFAFFAAGVPIGGLDGLVAVARDPIALGIVVGLVVGKPVGIVGTAWLLTRVTRAHLDPELRWADLAAVGTVAGIGFTVSLLVAELSFPAGSDHRDHAKLAVLLASIGAAALAAVVVGLGRRRAVR